MLPGPVLDWLSQQLQYEYVDASRCFSDTTQLLTSIPSLRPRTDVYTSETGHPQLLLVIAGAVPTVIAGTTYGIPLELWVPKQYPLAPPMVYVRPTETMRVAAGSHVDANGRCYFEWTPQHTLIGLVAMFQEIFSREPPVYAVQSHKTPSQSPHPGHPQAHPQAHPQTHPGSSQGQLPSQSAQQPGQSAEHPVHSVQSPVQQPASPASRRRTKARPAYNPQPVRDIMGSMSSEPATLPPLPPTPQKIDTLNHLDAALRAAAQQILDVEVVKDAQALQNASDVLTWLEGAVDDEKKRLNAAKTQAETNLRLLDQAIQDAGRVTDRARDQAARTVATDELVHAQDPRGNQVLQAITEDQAIGDTIYVLAKALDLERLPLDTFLKHTRALAREQFMARALALKAAVPER